MDAQERTPSDRSDRRRREQKICVLQPDELRRVVSALTEEPDRIRAFFLTVLLTGYRRAEVQQMRWKELDLLRAVWNSPAGASKRGIPQTLPLPQALVPYLRSLPRVAPCVFDQAEKPNWMKRYAWLTSWRRIQQRAQLRACPTHTLRYSFARYLAQQGYNPTRLDPRQLRAALDEYAQSILH